MIEPGRAGRDEPQSAEMFENIRRQIGMDKGANHLRFGVSSGVFQGQGVCNKFNPVLPLQAFKGLALLVLDFKDDDIHP